MALRRMWQRLALAAAVLSLAALAAALAVPAARSASDPFVGAWVSPDTDGDLVSAEIGAANADGVRRLTLFDPAANACNRESANAMGSGTVSGDTLTATLTVLCHGQVHFVGTVHFTLSGDTLVSDTSVNAYVRR